VVEEVELNYNNLKKRRLLGESPEAPKQKKLKDFPEFLFKK